MQQGYFITVEGGEGAGKTSLIRRLQPFLLAKGFSVTVTREPGGIHIAEQIRSILLDRENVTMDGRTEALLYAAARRQHLVEKVIPALRQGNIVVCDRFLDSSLAYQGHARGLGVEEVLSVNRFAVDRLMPDLTLLLDIEPELGLTRIHSDRQREVNRLDLETLEFHRKVREGFLLVQELFPQRIVRIDAGREEDEVFAAAAQALERKLSR